MLYMYGSLSGSSHASIDGRVREPVHFRLGEFVTRGSGLCASE